MANQASSYTIKTSEHPPRRRPKPVLYLQIPQVQFEAIKADWDAMGVKARSVSALAGLRLLSGHLRLCPIGGPPEEGGRQ